MTLDWDVEKKEDTLAGKSIALGVCGGIGAVENVKNIRELRRYAAQVTVFMTESAKSFITPLSLQWASGNTVIDSFSASVEYLRNYDLVMVCPATLNTLSKAAVGVIDNVVLALIASQFGKINLKSKGKIVFVPTMNKDLFSHPMYKTHKTTLEKWGARFIEPEVIESRLKMPPWEYLREQVVGLLKEESYHA